MKFGGYLLTARAMTGMRGGASPAQALVGNVGTFTPMLRENLKRKHRKGESTDAR